MIFVTGDTHGDIDRFSDPAVRKLKSDDVLIVCGDFGFVWDGSRKEEKNLKKIGKQRFDTLFVEGCHDNYDLLKTYPEVAYRGGRARKISGNLYCLLRGEIYTICGRKVFAFGGGDSGADAVLDGGMWWPAEQPTEEEELRGVEALKAVRGKVDLVITHEPPASIKRFLQMDDGVGSNIHWYFDGIAKQLDFSQWYFGKYHLDKVIPPRYTAVYRTIWPAGGDR